MGKMREEKNFVMEGIGMEAEWGKMLRCMRVCVLDEGRSRKWGRGNEERTKPWRKEKL